MHNKKLLAACSWAATTVYLIIRYSAVSQQVPNKETKNGKALTDKLSLNVSALKNTSQYSLSRLHMEFPPVDTPAGATSLRQCLENHVITR